jgi:hypothetical protein
MFFVETTKHIAKTNTTCWVIVIILCKLPGSYISIRQPTFMIARDGDNCFGYICNTCNSIKDRLTTSQEVSSEWLYLFNGCFCTSYIVSNHIFDTDHCRQIEGRCQLSPRCLSKLLGFLKAKTGGSLKILDSSGCFCMVVQWSRTMLDKLLSAGWYVKQHQVHKTKW